jgi:membrane-bound lytic murein transglycosylase D
MWRLLLFCFASLIVAPGFLLQAQTNKIALDDVLSSAQQWANENLDPELLDALQTGDEEKIKKLLARLQRELEGEYVLDLGQMKDTAQATLPLLEKFEETYPYALWLKSRVDYFDVARELNAARVQPKPAPGQPPVPPTNPSASAEREIWIKKVAKVPKSRSSNPYVTKLKPIFAAEHAPPELVWVAQVESSFDPRARSPRGAAGLFQLMPDTGKRFGISTWPLDKRYDPEKSGQAAAKYLDYLHRHYHDWRLALAAYNAGEGTVDRLLKKRKAHGYDAISTRLPAETQMFVPRVEAVILKEEGKRLEDLTD